MDKPKVDYNDTFVRKEVTFFSLASTRWNNSIDGKTLEEDVGSFCEQNMTFFRLNSAWIEYDQGFEYLPGLELIHLEEE